MYKFKLLLQLLHNIMETFNYPKRQHSIHNCKHYYVYNNKPEEQILAAAVDL